MDYECTLYEESCNVNIVCTQASLDCIDKDCNSTVQVCNNYENQCETSDNSECTVYELVEIGLECLEYGFYCDKSLNTLDICTTECQYKENLYQKSVNEYNMIVTANQETLNEMSGFYDLESKSLFEIYAMNSLIEVNKTGIGPDDIFIDVQLSFTSQGSLKNTTFLINWNYFSDEVNANVITANIISLIVEGNNNLTQELTKKTPQEIYYEKIDL